MIAKLRKFRPLRALTATALGAIGFGGMSAAGYSPGAETTVGLDGSTLRDTVTFAVGVGSFFLPALGPVANVLKSLSNHSEVEAVTKTTAGQLEREAIQNQRLASLEQRVKALES